MNTLLKMTGTTVAPMGLPRDASMGAATGSQGIVAWQPPTRVPCAPPDPTALPEGREYNESGFEVGSANRKFPIWSGFWRRQRGETSS